MVPDTNRKACRLCPQCNGVACADELPGMGAVDGKTGGNFRRNVSAWDVLYTQIPPQTNPDSPPPVLPEVRTAPMTGAVQNMGFTNEEDWYRLLARGCSDSGVRISIGDGAPDIKLQLGLTALKDQNMTGAVFIKPYSQQKISERLEWCSESAEIIGIDIDSYRIRTMTGMAELFRKSPAELLEIKSRVRVPFALKGIFNEEDIDLVRQVKPDIIVISNHGGRVETRQGSSAAFLAEQGNVLRGSCRQLWVDGGIRKRKDLFTAGFYGADTVLVGRPFITGILRWGSEGIRHVHNNLING